MTIKNKRATKKKMKYSREARIYRKKFTKALRKDEDY